MIGIMDALKVPLQDENWGRKVVIGCLISLVPIANLLTFGYSLKYLRARMNDDAALLPEWREWGDLFLLGLKVLLVSLLYSLLALIVGGVSVALLGIVGGLIALLLYIASFFLMLMALVRFTASDFVFGAALDFKAAYDAIRSNWDDYLRIFLMLLGVSLIAMMVAMVPLIGWIFGIFASFYIMLVSAVLLAGLSIS